MVFTLAFLGFVVAPILVPFSIIYGALTLTGGASGMIFIYIILFIISSAIVGAILGILRYRRVAYHITDNELQGTKGFVSKNHKTVAFKNVKQVEQIQTPFQELFNAETIVLHLERNGKGNKDTWFDKRFTVSKAIDDDTIQIEDIEQNSGMFNQIQHNIESEQDGDDSVEYVELEQAS